MYWNCIKFWLYIIEDFPASINNMYGKLVPYRFAGFLKSKLVVITYMKAQKHVSNPKPDEEGRVSNPCLCYDHDHCVYAWCSCHCHKKQLTTVASYP